MAHRWPSASSAAVRPRICRKISVRRKATSRSTYRSTERGLTLMAETLQTAASTVASTASVNQQGARGLRFDRHFTKAGVHPFDEVNWELRDAVIQDFKGKLIFEQKDVEVPADWSMTATNIVASKYLHGQVGTPDREKGVKDLISRVAESIRDWGIRDGYFASQEDAEIFFAELPHLLVHQKAAFNSP